MINETRLNENEYAFYIRNNSSDREITLLIEELFLSTVQRVLMIRTQVQRKIDPEENCIIKNCPTL